MGLCAGVSKQWLFICKGYTFYFQLIYIWEHWKLGCNWIGNYKTKY